MEARWAVILVVAVLCCVWITGCKAARHMNDVRQVSYTSDAGSILPELQWHEEIIITKDNISLIRNGRTPDTEINEGTWELAVDEQEVAALFEQLEAIDRSTIKRIEPDSPLDGGNIESYTVVYAGERTFSLMYDPGTTYTDGKLIVDPIEAFLQNLSLPVEAAARYK